MWFRIGRNPWPICWACTIVHLFGVGADSESVPRWVLGFEEIRSAGLRPSAFAFGAESAPRVMAVWVCERTGHGPIISIRSTSTEGKGRTVERVNKVQPAEMVVEVNKPKNTPTRQLRGLYFKREMFNQWASVHLPASTVSSLQGLPNFPCTRML